MTTILVTHDDLDGMACRVVAEALLIIDQVHHISYGEIYDTILSLQTEDDEKTVIFADISPKVDQLIEMDKLSGYIYLADHHQSTLDALASIPTLENLRWQCKTDRCGAINLWETITRKDFWTDPPRHPMDKFLYTVDAYDRWQEESIWFPRGRDMNTLLDIVGMESMVRRGTSYLFFTDEKKQIKHRQVAERVEMQNALKNMEIKDNVGVLYPMPSKSVFNLLAQHIQKTMSTVKAIVAITEGGWVSIRACDPSTSVYLLAKDMFNGGGHPKASGGKFSPSIFNVDFESLGNPRTKGYIAQKVAEYLANK